MDLLAHNVGDNVQNISPETLHPYTISERTESRIVFERKPSLFLKFFFIGLTAFTVIVWLAAEVESYKMGGHILILNSGILQLMVLLLITIGIGFYYSRPPMLIAADRDSIFIVYPSFFQWKRTRRYVTIEIESVYILAKRAKAGMFGIVSIRLKNKNLTRLLALHRDSLKLALDHATTFGLLIAKIVNVEVLVKRDI
jgi:hypothetical protein